MVIQCDASTKGLGATLLQEGRPIASASRSLSKSEKKYVAIELECLAIVFVCRKFDQYIYGKKTWVETDHKPLEVITKKSILAAPRRLQHMLLSLQRYDLDIKCCPGEQQVIADTLSWLPAEVPKTEELTRQEVFQLTMAEQEAQELEVIGAHEFLQVRDQRLVEIQKAAMMDLEQKNFAGYYSRMAHHYSRGAHLGQEVLELSWDSNSAGPLYLQRWSGSGNWIDEGWLFNPTAR